MLLSRKIKETREVSAVKSNNENASKRDRAKTRLTREISNSE